MATTSQNNGITSPEAADIAAQIETLRADLAELTSTMSGYAKGKGRQARDQAMHTAESLGAEANHMAEQAGEMIRQRPAAALGAAAAVGFIVGFLSTRR